MTEHTDTPPTGHPFQPRPHVAAVVLWLSTRLQIALWDDDRTELDNIAATAADLGVLSDLLGMLAWHSVAERALVAIGAATLTGQPVADVADRFRTQSWESFDPLWAEFRDQLDALERDHRPGR